MGPKKAAVIGFPVGHSLSPTIHGHWLTHEGIEGEYGLLEIKTEPGLFEERLKKLKADGYVGVNITLPFKERAYKAMDELDGVAKAIGAVNTVVFRPDGTLFGTNTDAYGFIENIRSQVPSVVFKNKTACVLGAGGAARAVIYGLLEAGVSRIILSNRTTERAALLQQAFKGPIEIIDWKEKDTIYDQIDFLVNTTSLGMEGQEKLPFDLSRLRSDAIVVDIVYKPLETQLLYDARMRGNRTVDGLGMLIYQAQKAFTYFFDKTPEVSHSLRACVLEKLAAPKKESHL